MRKLIVLGILTILSGAGYTQTVFNDLRSLESRADYYYSKLYYTKAAELYSEALKKKKNRNNYALNIKAALLYKKLAEYEEAKKCYQNILYSGHSLTTKDSIDYFNTLRAVGDSKADTIFKKVYSRTILNNLFRDTLYYNIFDLPFNTSKSEYCPQLLTDQLIFVSEEKDSSMIQKVNAINNGGFSRLYFSNRESSGWSSPVKAFVELENILHVGPVTFYNNRKKALLNMCIEEEGGPHRLQIYSADFDEEKMEWRNLSPLPLNHSSYSLAHPTVSKDGKKLFFVSDIEGGMGGTDIYFSEQVNGSWTQPLNLGKKINTAGDEKYPYLTEDSILFFSSDGRYGIGGLDIYYTDLQFEDSMVVNMGYPVNSSLDDFGFSYHEEQKSGYFSSNRSSQGKQDDLYMYTENKVFLEVTLYDDFDKTILTGYTAKIWDVELNIPIRLLPGDQPNILKASLRPAHQYRLVVYKDDYRNDTLNISTNNRKDFTNIISEKIYLKRKPIYYASLKFKNDQAKENFADALILVNNLTHRTIDTMDHEDVAVTLKLDGDCEYVITSKNGDKLRYIYVEKKNFTISASIPYYNLYLGIAKPSILHLLIKSCDDSEVFEPTVKIWDWVNRNEFTITPGPEGDFRLVVMDARLFDLLIDGKKVSYSKNEIISDTYCIRFIENK